MKPRTRIARISQKKLASLGGRWPGSTAKRSSKQIKKKPRSKSERERIYGPKGYVEWIHEQPCIACGVVGFSEVAHIKTGGMGRKDDWTRTVPLCGVRPGFAGLYMGCHRFHDEYPTNFHDAHGNLLLDVVADAINRAWHSRRRRESRQCRAARPKCLECSTLFQQDRALPGPAAFGGMGPTGHWPNCSQCEEPESALGRRGRSGSSWP